MTRLTERDIKAFNRNPEKYGLIGWRRMKRKTGNVFTGLFAMLFVLCGILLWAAFAILPIYIVLHFVFKYW
jgi:hypothetical protein